MQDTVKATIALLGEHTGTAIVLVLVLLGGWLGWKLWQKYRFRQLSGIPHITANELMAVLAVDHAPLVLDLRGAVMLAQIQAIPGATHTTLELLSKAVAAWPKNSPIVTLCACPQDASAIHAARQLRDAGYLSVRPLKGGYAAWLAAQAEPAAGRAAT